MQVDFQQVLSLIGMASIVSVLAYLVLGIFRQPSQNSKRWWPANLLFWSVVVTIATIFSSLILSSQEQFYRNRRCHSFLVNARRSFDRDILIYQNISEDTRQEDIESYDTLLTADRYFQKTESMVEAIVSDTHLKKICPAGIASIQAKLLGLRAISDNTRNPEVLRERRYGNIPHYIDELRQIDMVLSQMIDQVQMEGSVLGPPKVETESVYF